MFSYTATFCSSDVDRPIPGNQLTSICRDAVNKAYPFPEATKTLLELYQRAKTIQSVIVQDAIIDWLKKNTANRNFRLHVLEQLGLEAQNQLVSKSTTR